VVEPIRSQYEDDPEMLELVREFAGELPGRARDLESRLDQCAFEDLQRLAHQLKGAGGGYGFPQITEAAASLEQALKEGAGESVLKDRTDLLCRTLRAVTVSGVP
jgi:HPt (histidine-containing phosphotransfer) domain-containing protein